MTAEMVERHKKKTERRREQAKKHREEEKVRHCPAACGPASVRAGSSQRIYRYRVVNSFVFGFLATSVTVYLFGLSSYACTLTSEF